MPAIAGLRGTGDFAANELPEDFQNYILWRDPEGDSPIFALTGRAKSRKATDPRVHWWGEGQDIVRVTINFSTGYNSTATTLTIAGTEPDSSNFGRVYGSGLHLKPGDMLLVENTTEPADFDQEILMVTAVTDANTIVVVRGAAGSTKSDASLGTDGTGLLLTGSAYEQGSNAPAAASRNPIEFEQFLQIFKDAWDISGTVLAMGAAGTRTGDPKTNEKKRKAFDHSRGIELSILFGQKHSETGPDGKPRYFMGGLREQIPVANTTIFTTDVTETAFTDAIAPVFDFSSRAGNTRICFGGNGFMNNVNRLAKAQGTINYGETLKLYGMNLREWILPQGNIYFRRHPLLSRHPQYTYSAFILDFSSIVWRYLRSTKHTPINQSDGRDAEGGFWLTEGGLQLEDGGLTCAYLGNVSSTA